MKRVFVFVYSSMRELRRWFHSLPGCLPSFSGFPRPTTAWHGSEMGRRGQWHQRMDIKRRAQLGPATIVRCGHSRLCQASQSCQRTVTGAASRLSLHIHQLGGHKGAFSLMACVMADGCLGQEGSECAQRPWSVVALRGRERVLFILQLLHWSILSANSPRQEIAMKYTHHAEPRLLWESSDTCKTVGKTHNEWM